MNLPKYSKRLCTLFRKMKIPKSDSEHYYDDTFLAHELRACARASCRYDVGNGTRSLARLVNSCKLFFDLRLLSAFDSFWRVINKRNGDLYCQE